MAKFERKMVWSLLLALTCFMSMQRKNNLVVEAEQQVPCFFVFGDSLADNGNNNLLLTLVKVNYPPYGIDFPDGPTGRFTNGRTTVDILGELLGFEKPIPSFLSSLVSRDLLRGVNYASGAAGILKESGKHMGDNISLRRQVQNHRLITSLIAAKVGSRASAEERLKKCLYWVGMGSNDYINNYFMPQTYHTSSQYNPEQYASLLIEKYEQHVLNLYKLGARLVVFDGVGQIGCTPNSISTYGTNGSVCVGVMNDAVRFFNDKLGELVDKLNVEFRDAKFVYINSTNIGIGDPTLAGFKVWDKGCCKVNKIGHCVVSTSPCEKRSEYVFWDSFHPTEASNLITANRVYTAYAPSDSYPMDVSHLVNFFAHPHLDAAHLLPFTSHATY